jgi:hypothetical protein
MVDRASDHSRVVVTTFVIWTALHVLLLLGLGLPGYLDCRGQPDSTRNVFGGCGISLGLVALGIGWIQLLYGGLATLVLFIRRNMAVGQGVLIGAAAVTLLFTALCFGATASG